MGEKPMTELLRKSGIIDKHITEFEKWRLVEEVGHTIRKPAGEMVEDLVQDIAKILEEEPVMRQTIVSPITVRETPKTWCNEEGGFTAAKDSMGHLIVGPSIELARGESIWPEDTADVHTIMDIEDLYMNDVVVAKMLTIEKEE